jgi:hypothetical protein
LAGGSAAPTGETDPLPSELGATSSDLTIGEGPPPISATTIESTFAKSSAPLRGETMIK